MWINANFDNLTADNIVVLANNRQVLAFKNTWALQQGISALPRVFSWQKYLKTTWRSLYPNTSKRLISVIESRVLMGQSMTDLGQVITHRLLDEVMKNFGYFHAHLIQPEQLLQSHSQGCLSFAKWITHYQQNKNKYNLLDMNDLSELIINCPTQIGIDKPMVYGFKSLTPEQSRLFNHIGYQILNAKQPNKQSTNLRFKTIDEEIFRAAQWAQNLHTKHPEKHLVIVSPTLNNTHYQIKSIFNQVFNDVLKETGQKTYNISLGMPLTQYPLIQHLLLILQLSQQLRNHCIRTETFNAIITSPYMAAAKTERCTRALLVNRVLALSKTHFKLAEISQYLSTAPVLKACIDAIITEVTIPQQAHDQWLLSFNIDLQTWGFATDRVLSSAEYQLFNKYQQTSLGLNQLAQTQGRVSALQAITDLKDWLSKVIFQAQSAKTPIQILGSLEAEGLYFDAAWVLGMSDDFLPPTLNSPRFIPSDIAVQHQIPHSSFELIAKDAKDTLSNLINLSDEVICSYADTRLEGKQQGSPLLEFGDEITTVKNNHVPTETIMETLADTQVKSLLNTQVKGGVSILRDQMACAFKGFIHRLNIQQFDAPHIGLNRMQQGNIIHKVLEKIYRQVTSRDALLSYDDETLTNLINTHIKTQLSHYAKSGFAKIEQQRLMQLIQKFIDTEKQRDEFRVIAIEQVIEANIAGLRFNTRLDRIDELPNGKRIIFDYKTGNIPSNPWCGESIKEPQLPIYALNNHPDGIGFIQPATDKVSYTGLAKDQKLLPNQTKQQRSCGEWGEQTQYWQQQLEQASTDYQQGRATVLPTKSACIYCEYDSLCRIEK